MRDKLRTAVETVARVLIAPIVALYRFKLVGYDATGSALSILPGFFGVFMRRAWYEATLERCGSGLSVQFGAVINNPAVHIGDNCFVGHYARLGLCSLGNDVMIGEATAVISGGGQYGFMRRDIPMRMQPGFHQRVELGDDLWIGARSVISSDVASHSIVSAGSVVNKCFEEWEILSGVPAEPIATRPARRQRKPKTPAPTSVETDPAES